MATPKRDGREREREERVLERENEYVLDREKELASKGL